MRGRHPSAELLRSFVEGGIDEARAVEVALHLDSCPACQRSAFEEDDLHQLLLDAADEPLPPAGLVSDILAEADAARAVQKSPGPAPAVAIALLGAAGFLFAVLGEPAQVLTESVTVGVGLGVVASVAGGPSGLGGWAIAPGVVLVSGLLLVGSHLVRRHRR